MRVLVVAPDPYLEFRATELPWQYLSVDLQPGKAMAVMDLTSLTLPDADRDLVIAYHVLEHIPNDHDALAEIARVLKPRGVALLEVPLHGDASDERYMRAPPSIRAMFYGQPDHVRLYGAGDFQLRLERAGLHARSVRVGELFRLEVDRAALMADEIFFLAAHARDELDRLVAPLTDEPADGDWRTRT